MKVIYISGQFPGNDEFVKINSKVMPQYASDYVSKLFYTGMVDAKDDIEVEAINILPIASWPNGSKCFKVPPMDWNEEGHLIEGVPYYNAIGVREYSKFVNLSKSLKHRIINWEKEELFIIAYGLSMPILKSFKYVKKKAPHVKTCLIVPDLPQYMHVDGGKLYHFIKTIYIKMQKKLYQYVDGMVYFSKHMNDYFRLDPDKWIVIEGIVNYKDDVQNEIIEQVKNESDKKIILYSGALENVYGICDLVKAFSKIAKKNYELQIIGAGGCVPMIKEEAEKDTRIKYLGVMDHAKVLRYQQAATLLINPRKPVHEFTKYSFPSKTLEYMASGTPVLMYKLTGIPSEYDEYLTYFSSDDTDTMARQMEDMCEKPLDWRNKIGETAKRFVKEQKNNRTQMLKLFEFVRRI